MAISLNLNRDMYWHHFDSKSDPEPQNLNQVAWYDCVRLPLYAGGQHIKCSNTLFMSKLDVGSSLRWLSASTMMYWHHFDSTSDREPQNLSQVVWVYLCKAATICLSPWTAYQCAQTCYICVIWMWEAVWGGCQPQPWHNDIILTPQETPRTPKVWAK